MTSHTEKYDLVVVGGGPAGLSAAVGAESERISTLVVDRKSRLGGQAGTSSLIENFPGFPEGITGPELTARMIDQALRFNTAFMAPAPIDAIEVIEEGIELHEDNERYLGEAALLSCGVDYRRLRARNLAAYLGRGVHYGSPHMSNNYQDKKMFVIGGANSAGQAAMHLSKFSGCDVHLVVRGDTIEDKMSGYLIDRITANPKIEVHTQTEVTAVNGNGRLENITLKSSDDELEVEADELFILIGADPKTGWLPAEIAKDSLGFILAGRDLPEEVREIFRQNHKRQPFDHETSTAGLFAAGDVRSGSNKRVALAVGDGMAVIPEVHQYRAL